MHQPAVDLLPRPVMAALKAMKDEFKPQPATWSLACNKRTIKLEIVWEKLSPAERTSPRQQDRGRQKTNRNHDRTGDYSKVRLNFNAKHTEYIFNRKHFEIFFLLFPGNRI